MTPRARSSSLSADSRLCAPRILNENTGCKFALQKKINPKSSRQVCSQIEGCLTRDVVDARLENFFTYLLGIVRQIQKRLAQAGI